jgi:signal transduction histidine kinase
VDVATELPLVMADPDRLRQAIWNLLTNAIKFTPNGGRVTVAARVAGSLLEVSVTDSGIGIAPEFLPHVFDAFMQAEGNSTRTSRGLGLGLTIARRIAEAHGGRVEADSEGLGRGSTFRLCLPLSDVRRADL